jgi:putative hydrolase of the HAD superfamily
MPPVSYMCALLRSANSGPFALQPLATPATKPPPIRVDLFLLLRAAVPTPTASIGLRYSRIAERLGWPGGNDAFLAESLPSWQPFSDTNPALAALKATGYRLDILSNVDRDFIEGTQLHFAVPFDFVITAGDVRSYKPADGHFLAGRERAGGYRWLHAAQSWYHDIIPARRLGIPAVWVNRKDEPLGNDVLPAGVVRDMAGLVSWLEA